METHVDPVLAGWFEQRLPAAGGLDPAALLALAEELSGRADLWSHLVEHDEDRRIYARIHRDDVLDA